MLNIFISKMALIAYLFRKLQTVKGVIRQIAKRSLFRRPFNKRHGKRSQTLLKFRHQHLYHIFWSLWNKSSRKTSLLVICKILGLFVNALTPDNMYSLHKSYKLAQRIHFLNFFYISEIYIKFWTFS